MNNNEPNKIITALFKRLNKLNKDSGGFADNYDYKAEEQIKKELTDITQVVGAIEVMSKNNILKLITMQSKLRFMPEHRFYMAFSRAVEYMEL